MSQPKVTVCVVTYNQQKYIGACLRSIVEQETDFPFEVIVADDCSSDSTRAIVLEYAERFPTIVKPLLRQANVGAVRNFVETHNAATGVYVAHIDGDDLMLPGKLRKQADFLDANPNYSVVWHRVNLFDDQGRFLPGGVFDISFFPNGTVTLGDSMRLGSVAVHSSIMYRRSARKTRDVLFEVIDLFYTWELLSSGKGKILSEILGEYRMASEGSMVFKGMAKVQSIVAHHAEYYLRQFPDQRKNIFSFALINFLVEVKNRRPSAWSFGRVALHSISAVSPRFLIRNLRQMQRLLPSVPIGSPSFRYADDISTRSVEE